LAGLTAAEKQSALDMVLESTTFLRAPQLRNFLAYIGRMEIAGRASELNEYLIGVEALGRKPGYSTTDDSTVRRRAHALREKLEQVYATELSGTNIRVDLPKGSYIPRFILPMPLNAQAEAACAPVESVPDLEAQWSKRRFGILALVLTVLLGAAATTVFFLWFRGRPKPDAALAAAWGPFLRPEVTVAICLASPPHFGILPYPEGPLPPGVPDMPEQKALLDWYRQRYPLQPGERLRTHLTSGPIRLGEVRGLITVIRAMDRLGINYDVVPERDIAVPALRGRNLLLFANPEFSFAAEKLLDKAALTVVYDPSRRERVIREQRPGVAPGRIYVPARGTQQELTEVFGLLTVLPSEGSTGPGQARTVIISCTNSAGCEAAAEFFCSEQKMRFLSEKLRQEKYSSYPPAYQVVIRSKVHQSQAVTSDYEWHYVLQAQ
jgi:hypothetical protein